ncbi:MAG: hypothetical protein KBD56_04515 [Candidatus Eisenbacteria bacterium]|nr:hypothetical protein [Candidatus Eisenbacteria bacterium]
MGIAVLMAAGALFGCLFVPERGYLGEAASNQAPFCRITGGILIDTADPALAEQADASVHFYWFGGDTDGVIRYFEWAIDDTTSADAWHITTAFDEVIPFSAFDRQHGRDFSAWHTFFLRSVDDDFTRSRPDRRFFNAHTIAPKSEIVLPSQHRSPNRQWARTLRVSWRGEDPDASQADRRPAWYEYKWIDVEETIDRDNLPQIRRLFDELPNEFMRDSLRAGDFPPGHPQYYQEALRQWVRVPGTVTEVWLENMIIDRKYGFCVRAIDEAGAVEPDLNWDNWTIFAARDKNILVYLSEPALGWRLFTAPQYDTWEVSVAPDQRFRFQWTGDASGSGTDPGPTNYGLDIPDPQQEIDRSLDGMGGWIGWATRSRMDRPVYFSRLDEGLTHHFYLKMRDVSGFEGTETRAHVAIRVLRFSFHKKFLLVDDLWSPAEGGGIPKSCGTWSPADPAMDAWHEEVFASMWDYLAPGDRPDHFGFFGEGDALTQVPDREDYLETLASYQTLIWSSGDLGIDNGLSTLALSGDLARYIGAGGNLVLLCTGPVTIVTQDFNIAATEPKKPSETLSLDEPWDRYSVLYQQFHLRGPVDKPRGSTQPADWPNFRKSTMVAAQAENPIYPDLPLDWERWDCSQTVFEGGMLQFEALWPDVNDLSETPWYGREEGLETMYRARTYKPGWRLDGLPVAWRTSATAEDRALGISPGRIVIFAFHPYYFEREPVRSAMTLALQWVMTGSDF